MLSQITCRLEVRLYEKNDSVLPITHDFPDVPADELSQFKFWVEYAAASYCYDNYASKPGHKLTCSAGNCPDVEQSDTSIVYDFSK